jgi:hypothetical protein
MNYPYQFDAHVWAWRLYRSGMNDLFEAYARTTDPETSHAAAASLSEEDIARLEREVVVTIRRCRDGATWDEVHDITGIDKASLSPRWKPLRLKNLLTARFDENGKAIKRRGRSGRNQTVWFST